MYKKRIRGGSSLPGATINGLRKYSQDNNKFSSEVNYF